MLTERQIYREKHTQTKSVLYRERYFTRVSIFCKLHNIETMLMAPEHDLQVHLFMFTRIQLVIIIIKFIDVALSMIYIVQNLSVNLFSFTILSTSLELCSLENGNIIKFFDHKLTDVCLNGSHDCQGPSLCFKID